MRNLQKVTKGQLLFLIEAKPYVTALKKAKAELVLARREVNFLQTAIHYAQDEIQARQASLQDATADYQRISKLAELGIFQNKPKRILIQS